ncbi:hypothetical protein [Empedobacter falsenii]|uniref:Uncharacterized protein n=1 Tax=Empedobacter falsenii TaxID=343874 RepID=A0A427BTN4_9FLAO|nr:hypothetical protein [Empedobacter falsenii]RRT94585.1 hypothetical protein EGI89_00795 [Empedobacter falsenii]RRT94831.1 hypothetical protein EGI88_00800 [Empedobacter falsenii]
MKDYSNLFKDTFNKILKERIQAQFVKKSLEIKIDELYFDGHALSIRDPFKLIYDEKSNTNFTDSFQIEGAKIIIEKGDEFGFYNKVVSDIYCQQIAIVFENVINLFLKIFKQFEVENKSDFESLLKSYKKSKEGLRKNKFLLYDKMNFNTNGKKCIYVVKIQALKNGKISIRNLKKEIRNESLKSYQCMELIWLYLSNEIKENNLKVVTNKYLSQNIFEFLTFMKDSRNSIIHNDNIIKGNQNTHFKKKYFIVEKLENDFEKISLDFQKTKMILEDYSFVVYLIYCALNLKYNNEDVLKVFSL